MIAKEKEGISVLKNEHEVHDGEMGKAPAKMQAKCTIRGDEACSKMSTKCTIIRNGRRDMLKCEHSEQKTRISPPSRA